MSRSPRRDPSARLIAYPATGSLRSLIADAGEAAGWRSIDFFTANIRNPNTRRAYLRACRDFFGWREGQRPTVGDDPAL